MKCPKCKSATLVGETYHLPNGSDNHLKCPLCGFYYNPEFPPRRSKKVERLETEKEIMI